MTSMPATDNQCARHAPWVALLLLLSGGCGDSSSGPSASRPAKEPAALILVVSSGPNDPYTPMLEAGARRAAKRVPAMEVRFVTPQADTPGSQAALLLGFRDPKLAGVCVHPHDAPASRSAMEVLATRGLAMVSLLEPGPRTAAGHVGLSDEAVGQALAVETAQAVGGEGQVMLLHAGAGHERYGMRLRAFEKAIRQTRVEVLASLDCGGDPFRARRLIAEHAARYPRLSAWVSLADWPLREPPQPWPLPETTRLITVGGTPAQWPLVENGHLPRLIAADCSMLVEQAVDICEASLRSASGAPGASRIVDLPLRIVAAGDLEAYRRDWIEWSK